MRRATRCALGVVLLLGLAAADCFGEGVDPKTLIGDWEGHWTFQGPYTRLSGQYFLSIKSVEDAGRVAGRIDSQGAEDRKVRVPAVNANVNGRLEGNRLTLGRDEFTVDGSRMSGERRTQGPPFRIELKKKE